MHAGGVLIAPGQAHRLLPAVRADGRRRVVSQFDKDDVEAVGLVKFDFLGLTTLTILDWALRYVQQLDPASRRSRSRRCRSTTRATYEHLPHGNTTAVFQFESRGMRDLLKQARPDRFEDIIALVALYRPGSDGADPRLTSRASTAASASSISTRASSRSSGRPTASWCTRSR